MKYYLLLFFIAVFQFSIAQVEYEKGYVVENNGDTIQCFIKNFDWAKPPNEIEIKKLESDKSNIKTIMEIQSFEIYNSSKYIRKTIMIDKSMNDSIRITTEKNPIWINSTLFVQVLIEGEANLYSISNKDEEYFYYSFNNDSIHPLICKKYYTNQEKNVIATNNLFRSQLWNNIKYDGLEIKTLQAIDYNKESLIKYFKKYNESKGKKYKIYFKSREKPIISVRILGGNYNTHSTISSILIWPYKEEKFSSNNGFHFGVEFETIFPINRRRFAFVFQPIYEHFYVNYSNKNNIKYIISYNCLNFPIGARYYIIKKKNIGLSISMFFTPETALNFNSFIKIDDDKYIKIVTPPNFKHQITFDYKKWGIYYSYIPVRMFVGSLSYDYEFSSNSISLVYKLK
jgi:hypothetical protein